MNILHQPAQKLDIGPVHIFKLFDDSHLIAEVEQQTEDMISLKFPVIIQSKVVNGEIVRYLERWLFGFAEQSIELGCDAFIAMGTPDPGLLERYVALYLKENEIKPTDPWAFRQKFSQN
jgi:hypothetical protein